MKAVKSIDITIEELYGIVEAVQRSNLPREIVSKIKLIVVTIEYLCQVIEDKSVSIRRLLRMIFGAATESARKVAGKTKETEVVFSDKAKGG